jgi:cytochrome c oxidase subunit 3
MADPAAHGALEHAAERSPAAAQPAEHFDSLERQDQAAHLGMWIFLTSEVLLFGALFGLYTAYSTGYGDAFDDAARHNNVVIGTLNTFVLVTSSFSAAWAVHATRRGRRRTAVRSLAITALLGAVFLVLKGIEYTDHFAHGIFPGQAYAFHGLPTEAANVFFTLYYLMTGLHALHVIGGLAAIAVLLWLTHRGHQTPERHTQLERGVLYWHLVDVIWIFLWPLMYLAG